MPLRQNEALQVAISAMTGPGVGVRFMLSRWFAMAFELRNDFYLGSETRSVTSGRLGVTLVMPAH